MVLALIVSVALFRLKEGVASTFVESLQISERYSFVFTNPIGGSATIHGCTFSDIASSESGGAIEITSNNSWDVRVKVELRACMFVNCSSDKSGGVVEFTGYCLSILFCCVWRCSAADGAVAMVTTCDNRRPALPIRDTTLFACNREMPHGQFILHAKTCEPLIHDVNSTKNRGTGQGLDLRSEKTFSLDIQYVNMPGSECTSLMMMSFTNQDGPTRNMVIESCNIGSGRATHCVMEIKGVSETFSFSKCSFVIGDAKLLDLKKSVPSMVQFEACVFDIAPEIAEVEFLDTVIGAKTAVMPPLESRNACA